MFRRDGIFNGHYFHCADENSKAFREIGRQRRFFVNIWLMILNLRVRPIFLPNRLNEIVYVNVLEELLDNVLLKIPHFIHA